MRRTTSRLLAIATMSLAVASYGTPLLASNFDISDIETDMPKTLGSGAGQTGTVETSGSLTTTTSTVAVTVTGNNATITNFGTLASTGTSGNAGRVIRDNTGVTGLMINNGSSTNASASMTARDADIIQMNKANASVTLNNYGTMQVDTNPSAGGNQAVDFNAITNGSNVVNNYTTGRILTTEADAVRPGVGGIVNNAGTVKSSTMTGSSSDGIDAQNNTSIVINNAIDPATLTAAGSGLIEGGRHGITGGPKDASTNWTITVTNNANGTIRGDNGSGINLDGFNNKEQVTITNYGTITGTSLTGDSDGIDVDGLVNLNNAGTIHSLNAHDDTSEGLTAGGGTVVNSGTIQGSIGNPTGNTGTGRGITIAGIDKDADGNAIPVQAPYAATSITNSGLIQGDSDSGIAFTSALASGFANTIANTASGTVKGGGTTAFAIRTGADNDTIKNAGLIDGSSSGKAIDMGAGNNDLQITGGQILGAISGGLGGTNTMEFDLGAGKSFDLGSAISNFSDVTIRSGTVRLQGDDLIDPLAALTLNGGTFDLNGFSVGGAGVNGFSSLLLNATSFIDFGDPISLEFGGLDGYTPGSVLNLLDFELGDHLFFTGNPSDFTSKFGQSDVCAGGICGYTITDDGSYYEVDPVPEPASLSLMGLGLSGLVVILRRRQRAARANRRLPA